MLFRSLLTAVTIVVGMRIMGAMLISSLIIFPALTSMRVCRSFKGVVISSALVSVVCFFCGMVASFAFSTPAGASIVAANLVAFLLFALVGALRGRVLRHPEGRSKIRKDRPSSKEHPDQQR